MKRQVAILGRTPEFLRWSIGQPCSLRVDTNLNSVDQTEKRLRSIRAVGIAIGENRVVDGLAISTQLSPGSIKAFRLREVLAPWGGLQSIRRQCAACPANASSVENSELAGCFGWLSRPAVETVLPHIDQAANDPKLQRLLSQDFLPTQPVWYGLWSSGQLSSHRLKLVAEILNLACSHVPTPAPEILDFLQVLQRCNEKALTLDVELVPPGRSNGEQWTIEPHCDRCQATRSRECNTCQVCHKTGQGHPEIHRKVLGLRPYVDISALCGKSRIEVVMAQYRDQTEPS